MLVDTTTDYLQSQGFPYPTEFEWQSEAPRQTLAQPLPDNNVSPVWSWLGDTVKEAAVEGAKSYFGALAKEHVRKAKGRK